MKGLGCALALILFIAIVTMAGIGLVATSMAGYGQAREQTKQVAIRETEATNRTRIEWDARVEIAEVQADATRKTSWAFVGFYLLRALLWIAGALWLLVGVKAVQRWISNN